METPRKRSSAEISAEIAELEERNRQRDAQDAEMKQALKEAEENLLNAGEEKENDIGPTRPKRSIKKAILRIGSAAAVIGAGIFGAKKGAEYTGEYFGKKGGKAAIEVADEERAEAKKAEAEKQARIKAEIEARLVKTNTPSVTTTNAPEGVVVPPPAGPTLAELKLQAAIAEAKLQAENLAKTNEVRLAEIQAQLKLNYDKDLAATKAALSNEVANLKPVPPAKPLTLAEHIADIDARIKQAISEGKNANYYFKPDEDILWNNYVMGQYPGIVLNKTETAPAPQFKTGITTIETGGESKFPTSGPGVKITSGSVDAGGFNYVYNTGTALGEKVASNPSGLSREMLEKVNNVFVENLEKLFPENTLRTWRSVENRNVYDFMKPELKRENVKASLQSLFDHLGELKRITGLNPKSLLGGNETVKEYMERAYQKAAEKNTLDQVTLK